MNHRTTTLLVAIAAIAATLLAAGTVASLGSNYSAFAHKEYKKSYDKYNRYDKQGRDGDNIAISDQYLKCIVIHDGGITGNSCNNRAPTNTNNDNGGTPPTPTPTPIPEKCKEGTVVDVTTEAGLPNTGPPFTLPEGTVLCLNQQQPGNNQGITAILPNGRDTTTVNIVVSQVGLDGKCTGPDVKADVTSEAFTTGPLTGATVVCVHQVSTT